MKQQLDLCPRNWNVVAQRTRRSARKIVSTRLTYKDACEALDELRHQVADNKIYDCGIYRGRGIHVGSAR